MNSYLHECGCFVGGLFMGLAVIALAGRAVLPGGPGFPDTPGAAVTTVAVIAGSALLGKLVGLGWARRKMIHLAEEALRIL